MYNMIIIIIVFVHVRSFIAYIHTTKKENIYIILFALKILEIEGTC